MTRADNHHFEQEVKVSSLVTRLVMNIHDLGFEIPKTISKILCYWLHDEERANMAIDYFKVNTQLIPHLISHFEREEVYLPCSEVVKEALIHPELLKPFLPEKSDSDNIIFKVLNYVAMKDLAFSAEAYGMLDAIINCKLSKEHTISKDKETEHKKIVAKWLNSNYDGFWKKVHTFMEPNGSHLMIEQMLKLVYHILKNHRNYYVMIKYINDASNLTRIMRLLRVRNKKIQVMAFNVFKIFVANPQKVLRVMKKRLYRRLLKPHTVRINPSLTFSYPTGRKLQSFSRLLVRMKNLTGNLRMTWKS